MYLLRAKTAEVIGAMEARGQTSGADRDSRHRGAAHFVEDLTAEEVAWVVAFWRHRFGLDPGDAVVAAAVSRRRPTEIRSGDEGE